MRLLITGRGTSGSWRIRGEQLGKALGALIQPQATVLNGADVVIHVKRGPFTLRSLCASKNVPFVWDVVDAWPQPSGNYWSREQALSWLQQELVFIRPTAVIAATQQMASDVQTFGIPCVCIPHHARASQPKNPIREKLRIIGYQGSSSYISSWRLGIESICAELGFRFLSSVETLADVDVILALRDCSGYPARYWKSNVKLANAQVTGTPFVGVMEAGYLENSSGAEFYVSDISELHKTLIMLKPQEIRQSISKTLLEYSSAVSIETISNQYREFLESIK